MKAGDLVFVACLSALLFATVVHGADAPSSSATVPSEPAPPPKEPKKTEAVKSEPGPAEVSAPAPKPPKDIKETKDSKETKDGKESKDTKDTKTDAPPTKAKADPKAESKSEGKSDVKTDGKPDGKPEGKADAGKKEAAPAEKAAKIDPAATAAPVPTPTTPPAKSDPPAPKRPLGSVILTIKLALLADPLLLPYDIEVEMDGEKAVLTGKVATEDDKRSAAEIAQSVDTVKGVVNKLEVAKELGPQLVKRQDHAICQYVKERFARSETLKSSGFDLKCEEGVIFLSGKTRFQVIALEAAQAARQVPGVRAVDTTNIQLSGESKE